MASPIEDVSSLPGKTLNDQEGQKVGEIKDVYGIDGESNPMWITVESSTGLTGSRTIFVPIARVKEEDGEVRVPYSTSTCRTRRG
jgi:sporulation protein YlmC with PRC-barrel domain